MLEIKSFEFGPFGTNCYVVHTENEVLIIDPACSNQYEQQQLYACVNSLNLPSTALHIVATHGHLDHLWGAKWATEQWHMPVLMHEADIPMAQAMQQQYNLFGIRRAAEVFPIENLKSKIKNLKFEIINTPGHTPGSVCLYWPEEKVLFSGDTLFRMGYGRTDLPGGNMGQLIGSLEYLFALPGDVHVYPGHGEATTIAAERR
ncbi:MAG: MBL fold metallo-hydrolase [Paludibacteraceae bacterium]|nr:MBL fold metallo-hydrolase [Paludibacteraceae bacterium]